MSNATKWRVTVKYYRGDRGESSYSFTVTLVHIYDAHARREINIPKVNAPIGQCVSEFAMFKASDGTMSNQYPIMSLHIKPV